MNQHQEHHHGLHHQDHSENSTQTDISPPSASKTGDHASLMDELEKKMFERAK